MNWILLYLFFGCFIDVILTKFDNISTKIELLWDIIEEITLIAFWPIFISWMIVDIIVGMIKDYIFYKKCYNNRKGK